MNPKPKHIMADIPKNVAAATPNVKPAMALVSPEEVHKEWTYSEIVKGILEKKQKRSMCTACGDSVKLGDVNPNCVFFKHEKSLVRVLETEMKSPSAMYINNKEQGARLACYKHWTQLVHGTIGVRRRRPLPICVEAKIKMLKPSFTFKGYEETKEESNSFSDEDTWEGAQSPLCTNKKQRVE